MLVEKLFDKICLWEHSEPFILSLLFAKKDVSSQSSKPVDNSKMKQDIKNFEPKFSLITSLRKFDRSMILP